MMSEAKAIIMVAWLIAYMAIDAGNIFLPMTEPPYIKCSETF